MKLLLGFFDLFVPILFGYIYILITGRISSEDYMIFFLVYSLALIITSLLFGFYKEYFFRSYFSEKLRISFITAISAAIIQFIFSLSQNISIDTYIFLSWILIPVFILFIRYIIKVNLYLIRNRKPIYIIDHHYKFNDYEISSLSDRGYDIFFYDSIDDYREKELKKKEYKKKLLVINTTEVTEKDRKKIEENIITDIELYTVEEFMEVFLRKIYITKESTSILTLRSYQDITYFEKRFIDFTAVIIILPFLILLIFISFFVKLVQSPKGSIIFNQKRYSINNSIFKMYKIRTMHSGSDKDGSIEVNDTATYPYGKILRRYRLDEIPQIINIIKGDMHLVGPRAEWVKLANVYKDKIDFYNVRSIVRPGITGWAQVMFRYGHGEGDAKQKLMYDLFYIKNWSIWIELEICIKTLMVMLDKRGF